jgi:hypothetical protein
LHEAGEITTGSALAVDVFTRVVAADRLAAEALALATDATRPADRSELLARMRAARADEMASLARAAVDPATGERLAMLYKIDR